jgi:hypothetical protein
LRIDANQQAPHSEGGPGTIAELVAHYRLKEGKDRVLGRMADEILSAEDFANLQKSTGKTIVDLESVWPSQCPMYCISTPRLNT